MSVPTSSEGGEPFDLVVFDYDGVCTPSAREFIEAGDVALDPIRPGLDGVIAAFRERGAAIALVSNEFDRSWMSMIDGFPEFDHVIVGSDNRIFKPDRRIFQRALRAAETVPNRCLVIDDDELNVRAARSVGCHAVEFDPDDAAGSWRRVLDAC